MSESNQCYCGVTEQMLEDFRRRNPLRKWQKTHLRWYVADRLPGVGQMEMLTAYRQSFAAWQSVCGLTFEQTKQHSLADLIILTRSIDGRNGTLAEHQLPPGNDMPLRGWFDIGEGWTVSSPPQRGKIDLVAVATHEFGHGIGISHIQSPRNLMNPVYDPGIRTPQQGDIDEATRRYGPPRQAPEPDPVPVPGSDEPLTILIETKGGQLYGPALVHKSKT